MSEQNKNTPSETYEAPRIVSHSAEHLKSIKIDVNACNSAFGASEVIENSESGQDTTLSY